MVDARDLKSCERKFVRVRIPLSAPLTQQLKIAGWSSTEARRAHNPKVAGSNPAPATNFGAVAQLARAFGSYPTGHRFESSQRHQTNITRLKGRVFVFSSIGSHSKILGPKSVSFTLS